MHPFLTSGSVWTVSGQHGHVHLYFDEKHINCSRMSGTPLLCTAFPKAIWSTESNAALNQGKDYSDRVFEFSLQLSFWRKSQGKNGVPT